MNLILIALLFLVRLRRDRASKTIPTFAGEIVHAVDGVHRRMRGTIRDCPWLSWQATDCTRVECPSAKNVKGTKAINGHGQKMVWSHFHHHSVKDQTSKSCCFRAVAVHAGDSDRDPELQTERLAATQRRLMFQQQSPARLFCSAVTSSRQQRVTDLDSCSAAKIGWL